MIFLEGDTRAYCATGEGGGQDNSCAPGEGNDKTWMSGDDKASTSWDSDQLKVRSPIKGGDRVESVLIKDSALVVASLKSTDLSIDDVVSLGGGPIRGSHVSVSANWDDEISVEIISPIDPEDPSQGFVSAGVSILRDEDEDNALAIHYGSLFPMREVKVDDKSGEAYVIGDVQPDRLTASQRSRIASILMERFAESVSTAEKSGFAYAEMFAVGSGLDGSDKGYRLWPQFGFDGTIPTATLKMVPDDIALKAAGVAVPSPNASRIPHATVLRGLRASAVKSLTIQQLISTPEGDRWWNENGHSISLRLDFKDKSSPGYKRFSAMKAKIEKLRKRNKSRSLTDFYFDLIERRAFCPTGDGGGVDNSCSASDGGGSSGSSELSEETGEATISSMSSTRIKSGKDWKKADDIVMYKGKNIPAKSLAKAESVSIVNGKLMSGALRDVGVSLDSAARMCAATQDGATIVASHGLLSDVEAYFDNPEDPPESHTAVTFFSKIDVGGIDNAVAVGTTLALAEDDTLVLSYGMLDVTPEAKNASPVAIAREMYRSVSASITEAEKAGVSAVEMVAAGSSGGRFQGYRIWPRMGFDGVIPRSQITPTYTLMYGFFNSYGSSIPDGILSPRAIKEKKAGALTIQALYETPEGQDWWEKNGGAMEMFLTLDDKNSPGMKRFTAMRDKLSRRYLSVRDEEYLEWIDFEWRSMVASGAVEFRNDDCGRDESGRFGSGNDCASEDGPVESESKAGKKRNVDVMIGGGKRVAVMDQEAKDRASKDFKAHPKPDGSASGSTTDIWDRDFAARKPGSNKISELSPAFPPDALRQNGQYVAHEAVGQYLSMRHEDERAKAGGSGPGSIIDLNDPEIGDGQIDYVADALAEDAVHAYEVLQVDPGFYSTDLKKTMDTMSRLHPELESDENSRFVFTALLAITSSGQGPDANLADADGLYRMWKEHGTVVPSVYGGGSRDVTTSLRNLQSIIDSLGIDRTRRLLSGYAPASRVAKTFKSLAQKSGDKEWRERTGSSELNLPKPLQATGELKDEVVPLFSVFGPKIGSFYANLSGRHDFLTMDRWLMRSVGRVTGDLVTRSTPAQAKARAKAILDAIESGKWKKSYLFGTDSSHGITKESLVRSLKIQEKTGVIEENGAAFIWATAAERSHQKTKRPSGGGYGRHEDDVVHSLHQAGNSLFKSLVHEQQDPRTGTARSNIREVFRRVGDIVEKQTGRRPDVDEVQAALWQYEKRLWKHLGAKTNIEDNSLFSSAADGIASGRIPPRKYTPSDKRSAQTGVGEYDTYQFDEEQAVWTSDLVQSGVDIVELVRLISEGDEESRNFAALDFGKRVSAFVGGVLQGLGMDSRAFCPTGEGGGVDNSCDGSPGSSASGRSPESLPKSFPRGSEKFRDAIDAVSPIPKAIWDRSKGRADTPPDKILASAADEQATSGESLSPEAEASYKDLIDEIGRQYESLVAAGLKARGWRGEGEPYGDPPGSTKPNSDKMREEVAKTGEFSFFMTEKGFGTGPATPDHPMLRETKYKTADGEPMIANDLFRVVHDMVAHVRGGYSFSTNGEYNGMLTHASTLPESAWPALFAETFGQNAVYEKTGKYAAQNAYASKIGPEIIRSELAKRSKKLSREADPAKDGDEPLGYQHLKVRPWLMDGKAESRSADCGRDEGGRFGSGNDCAADDGGAAAEATKSSDRWSSNENLSWPETSRDSSPPPMGDGRYGSINVAAPQRVKQTLDAAGVTPELAPILAGGSDGSDISVRPAPDFSNEFPGSGVTPVMFAFERDFGGVEGGMHGSSVIGVTSSGDTVVYHSTVNVDDAIKERDSMRHAAAREFYRAMTSSVDAARKAGVARIVLSAAGNSSKTHGSPWRGYTIWPRMGFDAPLPDSIRSRLPESLSRAKSLLDLHATPEGTRWWRDNGEDIDVSFDLRDASSPQSKVMDRFIKKFSTSKRSMPDSEGDEWLSPEDMLMLDEMWGEIWDDGVLSGRGSVDNRAFCPTGDGGGVDNSCSSSEGGGGAASATISPLHQAAEKITTNDIQMMIVDNGVASSDISESVGLLKSPRRFELVGSVGKNMPLDPVAAADFARDTISSHSPKARPLPDKFLDEVSDRIADSIVSGKQAGSHSADPHTRAVSLVATLTACTVEYPEMADLPIKARNSDEVFQTVLAEGGSPIEAVSVVKAVAFYSILDDDITINVDASFDYIVQLASSAASEKDPRTKKWGPPSGVDPFFSTSQLGHVVVHEDAHRLHWQSIRGIVGVPVGKKLAPGSAESLALTSEVRQRSIALLSHLTANKHVAKKMMGVSGYAATKAVEFVAEYYTALRLEKVSRDQELDDVMDILGFPRGKLPAGKPKKGQKQT